MFGAVTSTYASCPSYWYLRLQVSFCNILYIRECILTCSLPPNKRLVSVRESYLRRIRAHTAHSSHQLSTGMEQYLVSHWPPTLLWHRWLHSESGKACLAFLSVSSRCILMILSRTQVPVTANGLSVPVTIIQVQTGTGTSDRIGDDLFLGSGYWDHTLLSQ